MGDGVVFVAVAAGAIHGEAEKGLGGMLDNVVEPHVAAELVPVAGQEAGGSQCSCIGRGRLVSRQHLHQHPVIALVGVQRVDDPVPPAPDMFAAVADFFLESRGVAVAPDVHPVSGPAFAVAGAFEQPVDGASVGSGRSVSKEGSQLISSRRQPQQVEINPAQEDGARWFAGSDQASSLLLAGDEPVDLVAYPGRPGLRGRGAAKRLVGPVFARVGRDGLVLRGDGALGDPLAEQGYLLRRQGLALPRHAIIRVLRCDPFDQQAPGGLAVRIQRPAVAALAQEHRSIQAKPAFLPQRTVAGEAMLGKDWLDLFLVIDWLIGAESRRA